MFKHLLIEYADPSNLQDSVTWCYGLRDYPIVSRWINLVHRAQERYKIDDPARFYGFGDRSEQVTDALDRINQCITAINLYSPIIDRHLTDIDDQDTLNYLHHQFELYHGLLDAQQGNGFWCNATPEARLALANLNIAVHRCETIGRGAKPRHVVTWFGLPKTEVLHQSDYVYFEDVWSPGTVFLNYVEIGKTLTDLAFDNDQYIAPGAFQPFCHFSADFVVKFTGQNVRQANDKRAIIHRYYERHQQQLGPATPPVYVFGGLPVADLQGDLDLESISTKKFVKSVSFK
jgi:hypothetical protein